MSKIGIRNADMSAAGKPADKNLAKSLLKVLAVGIAGGAALLVGGKKVGEKLDENKK